jgi:hypothetical protein
MKKQIRAIIYMRTEGLEGLLGDMLLTSFV